MARYYPIKVEVEGRGYRGDWTLCQGNRVCVRSAFGSLMVPLGRRKPEAWAPVVLSIIVRCWLKRQRDHREWQAKEAKRLGGGRRPRSRTPAG